MLFRVPVGALAAGVALTVACNGSIQPGAGNGGAGPGDDSPNGAPVGPPGGGPSTPPGNAGPLPPIGEGPLAPDRSSDPCQTIDPGPSPLRRLTRNEYDNTVRDLLGDTRRPARSFPGEETTLGFHNNAESRSVSDVLVEGYLAAAEQLAADAVANLGALLPCDPARAGEAACVDALLDGFGKRAWRRPLTAPEKDNLRAAFATGKTTGSGKGFADGASAVIQVMLLSPQFLYRHEQGVPVAGSQGYLRLGPFEVASRLSYLLWGSMPDQALMAAAEAGKLSTREEIAAQARRMLDDPQRAGPTVTEFAGQWLGLEDLATLDKEAEAFPAWKPELRAPMRGETDAFIQHVLWQGDGKLATLLGAPFSFMNGPLATHYGVPGVTGDAFRKVDLDPAQRVGLLTHAGLLSVFGNSDVGLTSLVFRGRFVREQLLCQPIPDPPENAQDDNPPFTPTTTAREWSLARRAKASCGACHAQLDPIGLGFESFDAIGLHRTTDKGKPVDASGELTGTDVDGAFTGVPALARKLAGSQQVRACLATQWFRYGYGRDVTPRDACSVTTLNKAFAASGGNLRELLLALTQTDAFLFRSRGDAP
jgi:hypothetical protein